MDKGRGKMPLTAESKVVCGLRAPNDADCPHLPPRRIRVKMEDGKIVRQRRQPRRSCNLKDTGVEVENSASQQFGFFEFGLVAWNWPLV